MPVAVGHVLVVDDDPNVREVLVEFLEAMGHQVSAVENGAVALALVAATPPDVVCLDLWMDGMPGLEVLDHLARDHPRLPVVIVTADPFTGTIAQAQARGAFDYILKPFDMLKVHGVLQAAMASRALGH